MRNWEYAQEPFDLKLFILKCIKQIWLILFWILAGSACFGGIYYYLHVIKAGEAPYVLTNKYYLTYEVDPSDQLTYSYFAGYTWTDFLQSDLSMQRIKERMRNAGFEMNDESDAFLRESYQAHLESDLRILYVTVTGEKKDFVKALSKALQWEMELFPSEHREIRETALMTTGEPTLAPADVRTKRAFILGAVLGGFFGIFRVGFSLILSREISVPATLQVRFGLPVLGYMDKRGVPHLGLAIQAKEVFSEDRRLAVTAVDIGLNLDSLVKCLEDALLSEAVSETQDQKPKQKPEQEEAEKKEAEKKEEDPEREQVVRSEITVVPSILSKPEGIHTLRKKDGVILAVQAETRNGSAIAQVMMELEQTGVPVKALVLMQADNRLISAYLFGSKGMIRRKKL